MKVERGGTITDLGTHPSGRRGAWKVLWYMCEVRLSGLKVTMFSPQKRRE